MRVLVTGGCGFIGYNFVNYLISQNLGSLEVIVLDSLVSNTSRQNSDLLPENVTFINSDINEMRIILIFSGLDVFLTLQLKHMLIIQYLILTYSLKVTCWDCQLYYKIVIKMT